MNAPPPPTGWRRLTREPELLGVEAVRAEADAPADWEVFVPVLARLAASDAALAIEIREAIERALLATAGVTGAFEAEPGVWSVDGPDADGSEVIFTVGAVLDEAAPRLRSACSPPG